MHSGNMHPTLRARRHAAIRRLYPGVAIPTAAEEAVDRDAAYAQFSAVVVLLLGHAKNKAKFPLVFEENCNYGFRRNMYGMRLIGLSVASICATALGFSIYRLTSSHQFVPVISLVLEAANVVMILVWLFWVNEAAVRRGADGQHDDRSAAGLGRRAQPTGATPSVRVSMSQARHCPLFRHAPSGDAPLLR